VWVCRVLCTVVEAHPATACQKRPIVCQKSTTLFRKRPILCQKRATMCQKSTTTYHKRSINGQTNPIMCQKRRSMCQKRTTIYQKRPIMHTQHPCSTKFICTHTRILYIRGQSRRPLKACVGDAIQGVFKLAVLPLKIGEFSPHTKNKCLHAHSKEPDLSSKKPVFLQKSPTYTQKSPAYTRIRPAYTEMGLLYFF